MMLQNYLNALAEEKLDCLLSDVASILLIV
jgi:hypothetical protein